MIGDNITEDLNVTTTILDCPKYEPGDDLTIAKFSFWLEGVTQCCVAISGLVGNFISAFILTRYAQCTLQFNTYSYRVSYIGI